MYVCLFVCLRRRGGQESRVLDSGFVLLAHFVCVCVCYFSSFPDFS